jgi:hypothetical protein
VRQSSEQEAVPCQELVAWVMLQLDFIGIEIITPFFVGLKFSPIKKGLVERPTLIEK